MSIYEKYNRRLQKFSRVKFAMQHTQLCASAVSGSDSCRGDSGGPLLDLTGNQATVIGIVSFGTNKCDSSIPGVYSRVSAYLDWIRNKTTL